MSATPAASSKSPYRKCPGGTHFGSTPNPLPAGALVDRALRFIANYFSALALVSGARNEDLWRGLASLRKFRRAASIAQCSPRAGFRMLSSMWLRMALRAVVIRAANLLRSVSRVAASYKDFQSELESMVSIEEIVGTQIVT